MQETFKDELEILATPNIRETYVHQFRNVGYISYKLNDKELKPIKDEIDLIRKSFNKAIPCNNQLAGNLEKEYRLVKSKKYSEKLILPHIYAHDNQFGYLNTINYFTGKPELVLDNYWVNFQKKHEFNPIHNHTGAYSFVIWIDMPYDIKDEINLPSSVNSNSKSPAHFNFYYTNSLGAVGMHSIPADKKYNGVIAIFPAPLCHSVNPFFTSDKYRISVSGNFKIKID